MLHIRCAMNYLGLIKDRKGTVLILAVLAGLQAPGFRLAPSCPALCSWWGYGGGGAPSSSSAPVTKQPSQMFH